MTHIITHMKTQHYRYMKLVIPVMMSLYFYSCKQDVHKHADAETHYEENKSTTHSTDTAKLGKLLNLSRYKPTSVQFNYVFIDNSGNNERLSIPGPSDSHLQAILYFDSLTFANIQDQYKHMDYSSPGFRKEVFDFDWLNQTTKDELYKSEPTYHGHPDFCFGTGNQTELWFLNNKILVSSVQH